MGKLLTVSPSPHIYSDNSVKKMMYGVVIALLPTLTFSIYAFGWGAVIVASVSILSCVTTEFLIQKYLMKIKPTISDGSAIITGLLLAFNVPSNLPFWIIIIGAIVAIGVGKMSFGGLGNNPFNPALVGRVFLLISFPVQMTSWPVPLGFKTSYFDAITAATPLRILNDGVRIGIPISELKTQLPGYMQLLEGYTGGAMGEIAAFAILMGFIYMLTKKIITWHIPITILASIVFLTGIFWIMDPEIYADPIFHILTGGILLGAIFMAPDYVTSPMTRKGMVIYGIGIGFITVFIRVFGAYPEGISFAILIMNAFVPILDTYIKPKRFGEEGKNV